MKRRHNLFNRFIKLVVTTLIISAGLLTASHVFGAYPSTLDLTILSANQIKLVWVDNLADESGYKVDRKTDAGDFIEIATLAANSISYLDYSLTAGHIYTYRIRSYTSNNVYSIHTDEVSITANAVVGPVSLSVTPYSTSRLDLTWSYPESKTYDTVVERRSVGSTAWDLIATVQKGTSSYSDTNLTPNTSYYYRVKAIVSSHVYSCTYPNDSIGILAYTMFDAPSEFYGFASAPDQIYVLWNDIPYEASYVVERKTGSTGTYSTVATVPVNTTYWLDTKVTPNTRYFYRIKGVNGTNISNYSDEIIVASVHLEEPSNLTAVSTSNNKIELEWKDNSDSETGYEIWRKVGSTSKWEEYTTVGRNITYFTDDDLNADTQYFYRVRGIVSHSYVYSAFTSQKSAWTITMNAPESLMAAVVSPTIISLTWKDNSNSESGYSIERKTGDGDWIEIASLPANSTGYTDMNVTTNVQYYYRVKVLDNSYYNTAAYSDEIDVITGTPKEPSNLVLTSVSSSQIKLVWKDNSDNETGFIIERRLFNGVNFSEIARVEANKTSYLNNGLSSSIRYYYRVKAFNKTGASSYSNDCYIATKPKVSFKDVQGDGKERQIIENLASRGVFNSKSGGLFGPKDKITRGELMFNLVKALGLNMSGTGSFADVKKGRKYYNEIMIADKAGIIIRSGSNYFYPDRYVTREEMAVFITRALKSIEKPLISYDPSILDEFYDADSISDSSLYSIISVFGGNIMQGKMVGNKELIAPKDTVTRLEVALALYNIIDR